MKCPYLTKISTVNFKLEPKITEYIPECDEIAPQILIGQDIEIQTQVKQASECFQEECGAWQNGQCRRTS